ncbi:MAG: hypothetical protein Q7S55_02995 [Nanoarchaeota archaeon]|nr:hypothetical protein [Nanoarchaeota archaeon]
MAKLGIAEIAAGLGAKIVNIPEISKEDSTKYEPVGSPVMVPEADKLYIYYFGSRMLSMYKKSIDDVIGYRVLDADEELQFRQDCGNKYPAVVQYYWKK